jgi:uncharacterized Zn finger protein (UPF0148 family)
MTVAGKATDWREIRPPNFLRSANLTLTRFGITTAPHRVMQGASETGTASADIFFDCSHCSAPLVVDVAAAGMMLPCQRCGKPVQVPLQTAPSAAPTALSKEVVAELERRLKENASQRTEVISYINQLSIQLHRSQHRLKILNERQTELEVEMVAATNACR